MESVSDMTLFPLSVVFRLALVLMGVGGILGLSVGLGQWQQLKSRWSSAFTLILVHAVAGAGAGLAGLLAFGLVLQILLKVAPPSEALALIAAASALISSGFLYGSITGYVASTLWPSPSSGSTPPTSFGLLPPPRF